MSMRRMLGAAALAAVTACGTSQPAAPARHTPAAAAHPAPAASAARPAACPAVLAAVADVARKAGISLAAGSMHSYVTLAREAAWGAELGHANVIPPGPSAADVALASDVLAASTGAIMGNSPAGAAAFVAGLQKIQRDCG